MPAKRILFVDDEQALAQLGAELLVDSGFEVDCAYSGAEALQLFRERGDFDLVVTDETMPGMSGIELAQEIYRQSPNTPVLLCSGHMLSMREKGIDQTNIKDVVAKTEVCYKLPDLVAELL